MARATRKDHAVRWLWAAKGGRAGFVSLISIPGRRQTRRGVRAGRHAVPSAFINRSGRSGSLVVLKRTSRSRYPIRVQRIPIGVQADSAFNAFVAQSGRHFVAEFQRRLTARLKRR